jgi:hypothetical protein
VAVVAAIFILLAPPSGNSEYVDSRTSVVLVAGASGARDASLAPCLCPGRQRDLGQPLPSLSSAKIELRPNEVVGCTVVNAAGREMFLKKHRTPTF